MKKFWTRDSSILLGGFFVAILLIVYVWQPLAAVAFWRTGLVLKQFASRLTL